MGVLDHGRNFASAQGSVWSEPASLALNELFDEILDEMLHETFAVIAIG